MKPLDLRLYKYLVIEIFFLIALGGGVRAMNAGLACPDWPLCFGNVIPDYHPEVYFEFIHRALAGLVGIVSTYLNIRLMRSQQPKSLKALAGLAVFLLLSQVVMGGLTVLLVLQEKIVTLHLALAAAFFAVSLWIYLTLAEAQSPVPQSSSAANEAPKIRGFSTFLTGAVYTQMILGGLVASHYAALVCTDFPLCHGQWVPTLSGIIGLHVIHRFGAYTLTLIAIVFAVYVFKKVQAMEIRRWTMVFLMVLVVQIGAGISNVLLYTPPLLTVLHLALGTLLLGVAVRILHTVCRG